MPFQRTNFTHLFARAAGNMGVTGADSTGRQRLTSLTRPFCIPHYTIPHPITQPYTPCHGTTRRTTFPHHTLHSAVQHTEPSHPTHYRDSHRLPSMPRPRLAQRSPEHQGWLLSPRPWPRIPAPRPAAPSRLTAACWKAPLV